MEQQWTAETLKARIEEAGATLYCLPHNGAWPAGYRTFWPSIQEVISEAGWGDVVMRLPIPSASQITRMEQVDRWISEFVDDVLDRRILRARSLVNPRTGRPVISWRTIAKALNRGGAGVQQRHVRALDRLAKKISAHAYDTYTSRAMIDHDRGCALRRKAA